MISALAVEVKPVLLASTDLADGGAIDEVGAFGAGDERGLQPLKS
ncbi:hypothetical protein ABZ342_44355 [Amycolatopsis sp. NPDC005961]